jgi:NhaP-type Na+/H+ or K+/H+ antiporter
MGAEVVVGTGHGSILRAVLLLLGEIFGAIFLGFLAGVVLYYLLKFVRAEDKILGFSISSLLLVVGVSEIGGFDPILPAMVFGITTANLLPRQSKGIFELIKKFSPPIYVSFFVLAGAHMRFDKIAGCGQGIGLVVRGEVLRIAVGGSQVSWYMSFASGGCSDRSCDISIGSIRVKSWA